MGITVNMIDASLETLPMQRFMQNLVRESSFKVQRDPPADLSAKSVLDFDRSSKTTETNTTNTTSNTSSAPISDDGNSSTHSSPDTFDINSLVLVSDNARVFAKARPKSQKNDMLTSASWHSSSELRKMYTASARWGSSSNMLVGGPPSAGMAINSPPSMRNKPFDFQQQRQQQQDRPPRIRRSSSNDSSFGFSVQRRTSDSCLSIPKRSWMKPAHQQRIAQNNQAPIRPTRTSARTAATSTSSLSNSSSSSRIRMQPLAPPSLPHRSKSPGHAHSHQVASRFKASPLEAHMRSRPRPVRTNSSDSMLSGDSLCSYKSFESESNEEFSSCDDNEKPQQRQQIRTTATVEMRTRVLSKARDAELEQASAMLRGSESDVSDVDDSDDSDNSTKGEEQFLQSLSEHNSGARDSKELIACGKTTDSNASSGYSSNDSWSPKKRKSGRRPAAISSKKMGKKSSNLLIPPSLLLPYDRFKAETNAGANANASSSRRSAKQPHNSRSNLTSQSDHGYYHYPESSGNSSRRGPRLTRSRTSKSSGSKLSTRGSNSSLSSNQNGGLNRLFGSSRSMRNGNSSSRNGLGRNTFHSGYSSRSSVHSRNGDSLRSQSDHYSDHYSPVSTLELALGDMAPKRTKGRKKTVGRTKSSQSTQSADY